MKYFHFDLDLMKIAVPTGYKDGQPTGYQWKSVGAILDDDNPHELVVLEDWVTSHILQYIDWDMKKGLTKENVERALNLFSKLNIKPKDVMYDGDIVTSEENDIEFDEGNIDDFDE